MLISFWPRGSCFYMLNWLLEQGSHSLLGFRKYYFGFWELRISKNKKKFAFIRTYRPWFDKWLARYVFIFFIYSFFMQILNSQWNNRVNFFLLFFRIFVWINEGSQTKDERNEFILNCLLVSRDISRIRANFKIRALGRGNSMI